MVILQDKTSQQAVFGGYRHEKMVISYRGAKSNYVIWWIYCCWHRSFFESLRWFIWLDFNALAIQFHICNIKFNGAYSTELELTLYNYISTFYNLNKTKKFHFFKLVFFLLFSSLSLLYFCQCGIACASWAGVFGEGDWKWGDRLAYTPRPRQQKAKDWDRCASGDDVVRTRVTSHEPDFWQNDKNVSLGSTKRYASTFSAPLHNTWKWKFI